MSQPTAQRPPQVTVAAGVVMFSSVLVLLTAWERLSSVRSLDTRNAVEDIVAEPIVSGLGLDVEGTISILYATGVVAALCATATAILGWYVLKPDTSARRAVSILAVPVFVTGLTAGGFAASFVAAGAAMLWMQPAREWFATGKWTPPSPPPTAEKASRTPAAPPTPVDGPARPAAEPTDPPPAQPTGGPPAEGPAPYPAPWPAAQPDHKAHDGIHSATPHDHQAMHRSAQRRPQALVVAFVLTVVMAGGALVLSLLSMVLVGLSPDLLMTELERQRPELVTDGLTVDQLQLSTFLTAAVSVVWCTIALTFAGFAMARRSWARRGLMITAAFSAGACLLVALSAPFLVVPAIAAMATAASLGRAEVRSWFAPEPR